MGGRSSAAAAPALHGREPQYTHHAVDEYWETGFRYLQKYVAEHGNCVVSPTLKLMDGFKLGQWVVRQRVNVYELAPERRTRLESLRGWSWTPHMDKWEEGFHHLEEYSRKHGNCLVPLGFKTPNGYRLGQWVSNQRLKTEKTLLPVRRSRLESLIGWSWNPHSDQWVTGFHHLQRYVVEHGHSRPPSSFITFDGYKLGNWVVNLRARRKKNRLTDDKVKALEEMPGWKWSGR